MQDSFKGEVHYIVYDTASLKIVLTSEWYNKRVHDAYMLRSHRRPNLDCINVTHPKNKAILAAINEANGTNYH